MGSFSTVLTLVLFALIFGSDACTQTFKKAADIVGFTKSCSTKVGLSEAPKLEDLLKPDFDDKCYSKCILRSMDLIDEEGRLDRDALSDFIEDNADKPAVIKLTEIATSCADTAETEKVKGTKEGNTPEECKALHNFYGCFVSAADKLC